MRPGARLGTIVAAGLVGAAAVMVSRTPTYLGPPSHVTTVPSPSCHAHGDLPDPICTPGATNPTVTQATIYQTICVPGWTGTVRPPVAVTNEIKRERMLAYSFTGPLSEYELDHLIPLELGGAPEDILNLWPQLWEGTHGAHAKDKVENLLHRRVCAGLMPLAAAQRQIAKDWTDVDGAKKSDTTAELGPES